MQQRAKNSLQPSFQRRGIVEGFYGPPWSQSHRRAIFEFGARRGMNTYLYAPKDDPFHRERWRDPYPPERWSDLCDLIRRAHSRGIDFAYAFHPGKGLHFSAGTPMEDLFNKAKRLHAQGVQVFAVLFD